MRTLTAAGGARRRRAVTRGSAASRGRTRFALGSRSISSSGSSRSSASDSVSRCWRRLITEQRAVHQTAKQLCLLIGAGVLTGAFERLGQQRVSERLARDPLGVQRV